MKEKERLSLTALFSPVPLTLLLQGTGDLGKKPSWHRPGSSDWGTGTGVRVYMHVDRRWLEVRTSQLLELQISCLDCLPSCLLSQVVPSEPVSPSLIAPV